jgi:hypothetical protein
MPCLPKCSARSVLYHSRFLLRERLHKTLKPQFYTLEGTTKSKHKIEGSGQSGLFPSVYIDLMKGSTSLD